MREELTQLKEQKQINERKVIKSIVLIVLYRISLDLIYVFAISKSFAYSGFEVNIEIYKYIISMFITIVMSIPICKLINLNKASNIIVTLFNLFYFLPGCSLYALKGLEDTYFLFFCLYWLILMILQFNISPPKISLKYKIKKYSIVIYIIILFSIIALFIVGHYNSFKININLDDVYDLREEAREVQIPSILEYIRIWAAKIIPIGIVLFLINKNRIFAVLLICIQLLLFSFGGLKSTLFILAIAIFSYFFLKEKTYKRLLTYLILLGGILVIVSISINQCSIFANYIQRRMMYVPNLLSNYYYDYFTTHEKLYFRQSFLRLFGFSNPYESEVGFLIGKAYFNKSTMNACNGLVGDAFANFGWCSLAIFPFLIIIALKFLDACTEKIDRKIIFVVCVSFFNSFTNGAFFSTILSEGFAICCIFFLTFPEKNIKNVRGEQNAKE